MGELRGTGIGRGVVAGTVVRLEELPELPLDGVIGGGSESERATAALEVVANELRNRAMHATAGGAEVLEAQALMAADPVLAEEVLSLVDRGLSAPRAISDALEVYAIRLSAAGDYLAARVADLDDVRKRAVAECFGMSPPGLPQPGHPYVLVARDLAPADTVTLDEKVLALITVEGGPTSHTAILARAMGIPAVVGCADALSLTDGDLVTVDAARGLVLQGAHAQTLTGDVRATGPGRTADGHHVQLQANIGSREDIAAAVDAGAEGIGLLRTEFLDAYHEVFQAFPGSRVVVRVFDAGADKPLLGLSQPAEPNPALGVRGLRALAANPSVLDAQLRAIAEAADGADAEVWVMAPMVSEPAEAAWFAERCAAHGLISSGVMIEVPSAALLAEEILAKVDFASIGTNDLAQFTLAADRQLGALAHFQDPWHPALLRLIAHVGAAGAATGRPIGVCGEAAADPRLACVLVGLGVTSLSMAPAALADVREELARYTLEQCREMANSALG